jgi:hypothetical protein
LDEHAFARLQPPRIFDRHRSRQALNEQGRRMRRIETRWDRNHLAGRCDGELRISAQSGSGENRGAKGGLRDAFPVGHDDARDFHAGHKWEWRRLKIPVLAAHRIDIVHAGCFDADKDFTGTGQWLINFFE